MTAREIIESISPEEVLEFLAQAYNLQPHRNNAREAHFETVCHGGDSSKLIFYKDSNRFYCYTNCGSLSLYDLVMKLESCEFYPAFRIVSEFFDMDDSFEGESFDVPYEEHPPKQPEPVEIPVLPEKICMALEGDSWYEKKYYTGWINEYIRPSVMRKFDIRWCGAYNHIIIPHRDRDGRLVGIRRRALLPGEVKYMPIRGFEHPTGANLYGIEHFKLESGQKSVYLVEAEKSVLMGHSFLRYGEYKQVLATCGFNVSPIQIEIMKEAGIENVCLAFDKDSVGLARKDEWENDSIFHYKKLLSIGDRLQKAGLSVEVLCDRNNKLAPKDSPFDRREKVLRELIEEKYEFAEFEDEVRVGLDKWHCKQPIL